MRVQRIGLAQRLMLLGMLAAALAGSAWAVSTGGAAVLRRIADTVIAAMERNA